MSLEKLSRRRRIMAHVRTIRLFVLLALLATITQLYLSQGRQTKIIGSDRLVSVEPLYDSGGEICLPPGAESVMAANMAPAGRMGVLQQSGTGTASASI